MTLLDRLSAPFPPSTVSWRIGATTQDKSKGMALAYIDARDVQDRLNEVCGHEWQVKHHYCGGQMLACEIGIKIDGEWLWRGDGAGAIEPAEESKRLEEEQDMARKAAFSDSFKRAAVRWGIGRYLYDIDSPWVELEEKGRSRVIASREMARLRSVLMDKAQSNVETPSRPAVASARPLAATAQQDHTIRLSESRDAIIRALETADSPSRIDGILRVHQEQLKLIHAASIPTHDRLMRLAGERRAQLIEAPRVDAGGAPALMG
jgi:hypothetical protein